MKSHHISISVSDSRAMSLEEILTRDPTYLITFYNELYDSYGTKVVLETALEELAIIENFCNSTDSDYALLSLSVLESKALLMRVISDTRLFGKPFVMTAAPSNSLLPITIG